VSCAQQSKHRPDSRTDSKLTYGIQSGAELRADSGTERLANGPINSGQENYSILFFTKRSLLLNVVDLALFVPRLF
jgi:hypothetical protein